MQVRAMEFHIVPNENFISMFLDSTLQMTFKKLSLLNFAVQPKNIHHYLK